MFLGKGRQLKIGDVQEVGAVNLHEYVFQHRCLDRLRIVS